MQLQTFTGEYGGVRIVMEGEDPWFTASDVCKALGLSNVSHAVSKLDEDEKGITTNDTLGGRQKMLIVSESGLYHLVFMSRKAEAKAFRKWVTSEVLPAIRKYGQYAAPEYERQKQAQAIIDRWNHEYTHEWVPKLFVLKAGDTE